MPSERVEAMPAITELLTDLENAAKIPAKQRITKISSRVDNVASVAYDEGLSNASLSRVLDILALPYLDQASVNTLIRNLYPANKVSNAVVIKVVSSLGHGRSKISYIAQSALLRWLVLVYDVLENHKVLSQLYGVIFNLLDTIALRTPLCHVLSIITRRKHVRPYRIQFLMELIRQAGNEPPLVGLMRVYKDYYPDVIVGDATSGRASVFTHPDTEWRQRLSEIQVAHSEKTQDSLLPQQRLFRVSRRETRQIKSSVIPEVHTFHAQESSVTLEEIEDVHDFIRRLEKIEPPNQLVAVIQDPLLQKFLQLRSSDDFARRVDNWLLAFFEDQLQSPDSNSSESSVLEMLKAIRGYTYFTKRIPPACLMFLRSMLPSWDGVFGRGLIVDLLSYTPAGPWDELYLSLFQPMEEAVLEEGTLQSKLDLLSFYKNLLCQWSTSILIDPQESATARKAMDALRSHADTLALTIIQSSSEVSILCTVLTFYESVATILSNPSLQPIVRIILPPTELVYTLHFTSSLAILSGLCGILTHYKRAFEVAMGPNRSLPDGYPKDYVNHFNGFLMDICNCIWRGRAFNTTDTNALGCGISPAVTSALDRYVKSLSSDFTLSSLFTSPYSPVLCQLAIESVRELEDQEDTILLRHRGPVTQASLKHLGREGGLKLSWPEYRQGFLHYLENKGVNGVPELMYNTLKQLMSSREKKLKEV